MIDDAAIANCTVDDSMVCVVEVDARLIKLVWLITISLDCLHSNVTYLP